MKKRSVVLFGLLAALLAFGMVLTGCSGDSDTDLFKGTWKSDEGGPTYIITGGEFTMSMSMGEDDTLLPAAKGTVAASGNKAVLTVTHFNSELLETTPSTTPTWTAWNDLVFCN